jgi:Putative adhesin
MMARPAAATMSVMSTSAPEPRSPSAAWRIPGLILLVAVAAGGFAIAASARHVEVTAHTATYPAAPRLELDSGSGSIVVRGEDRGDIQLASRIRSTGHAPELRTDTTSTRLRVRASCHHRFFTWDFGDDSFGLGPLCATSYTAAVPAATSLAIELGQGDVRGDALAARTVSIDSGTGDVDLEFTAPPRNVQIDSGTGDVTVLVPAGSYAIQIDTGLGDAHVDQGIVSDPLATNIIRIDSGTGDVSVERSDV